MHHFGKRNPSFSVSVRSSYLTFRRSIFSVLILVLVNLQEIVHFNAEKKKVQNVESFSGLRRRQRLQEDFLHVWRSQYAQVRLKAHQPNLSEKKLKLLTHNKPTEPERDPTTMSQIL